MDTDMNGAALYSRRRVLTFIGAASIVGLLAACGSDDSDDDNNDSSSSGAGTTPTAAVNATTPPSTGSGDATAATGEPTTASTVTRERLTVGLSTEPSSLDASSQVTTPARMLYANIYDPLVHRDNGGELVPMLAEQWEQVDELTLQFTLRQGVTFHNGEEFNANAVKFSIERYADPASQGANKVASITEINVVDDYTIELITEQPAPLQFGDLVDTIYIVPPAYYEENGAEDVGVQPVGTGPFAFDDWIQGDRIELKAFEGYWGGTPSVGELTMRFIPEDSTRVAGLTTGELDIANDLPPAMANELKSNDEIGLSSATDPAIVHVGLNFHNELLRDVKIREALNHAVNKELIVERILFGFATVAGQTACPESFGYNPDVAPVPYDPDRAKQLLAEAGYPDGFEIDFASPVGYVAQAKEVAEAIVGDLAKVGVKANLEMFEWAVFNSEHLLSEGREGLESTYLMLKRYPSLDVGATMRTAYPSDAQWNYSSYSNERADELIEIQDTTVDEDVRLDALLEVAEVLAEDFTYLWLYWADWIHGARTGVNYTVRTDGLIIVNDITFTG